VWLIVHELSFYVLFINSVFMYRQKRRAANNESVKSKEFIKSFASTLPAVVTGKYQKGHN